MSLEELLAANTTALEANTNALLNVPAGKTSSKKTTSKSKTKTSHPDPSEAEPEGPSQAEVDDIVTEVADLDEDMSQAITLLAEFSAEKSVGVKEEDREAFIVRGKAILAAGRKKPAAVSLV